MQIIASSYPNENIPTSPAIFIFNDAFDIARSVQNVLGCTLLGDVQLAFNKHSDINCTLTFSRFYVDFTIHYLLAI